MYRTIRMTRAATAKLPHVKVWGRQLTVSPLADPATLDCTEEWHRLHATWRGKTKAEVVANAAISAYARFYESLNLNPKQTPPSVQNLIQRFLLKDTLERFPVIHPIVDAVNVAAVESLIPLGVFDAACVEGEILLDITQGGEPFHPLGTLAPIHLGPGLVVLCDARKVLSQFCYRDSEAQKVTPQTRSIWLLGCQVPGIDEATVFAALDRALRLLLRAYMWQSPESDASARPGR